MEVIAGYTAARLPARQSLRHSQMRGVKQNMKTFISYSHHDADVLSHLLDHLAVLRREEYIKEWYDRKILPGDDLDDKINEELEKADLILLLISPKFIASDYCVGREMKRALERNEAKKARVVPIIVESCDWELMHDLRRLKAIPKDGHPISKWSNPDDAYLDIVRELRFIIDAKVPRGFNELDRSKFRDAAFLTIKEYFKQEVNKIHTVNGLRGRFVFRSKTSFGTTVINRSFQHQTAHITVHRRSSGFAIGDIYYSFQEDAPRHTAVKGYFNVSSDGYEQFLVSTIPGFSEDSRLLNPDQAAKYLWRQFIKQAGIDLA